MNHSLVGADRNTHFKIIAVALVSAFALVLVGLIARMDNSATATTQLYANGPVLKAGKSMTVATRDGSTVR
jgi:hypothetical protein